MKHVKKILSLVLVVALVVTACLTNGFGVFAGEMASTESTSVEKIDFNKNNAVLFFLSNSDYGKSDANNRSAASIEDYNYWENIQIYTNNTTSKTLKEAYKNKASSGNTTFYNMWENWGSYAVSLDQDSLDNAVKIVIPAGTQFPSLAYTKDTSTTKKAYVTTEETIFINMGGTWKRYITADTSVSSVENSNGRMFFSLTNSDLANVPASQSLIHKELGTKYNMLDNILFYTTGEKYVTAREAMGTVDPQYSWNHWERWNSISFMTTLASSNVKFVLIKKGCEFPSYTEDQNYGADSPTVYKTTTDIVFNMNNGTSTVSNSPIIGVSGTEVPTELSGLNILKAGDSDYRLRVQLTPNDYPEVKADSDSNIPLKPNWAYRYNMLDMIDLYLKGQENPVSLRQAATGAEGYLNLWTKQGTFSLQMTGAYNGTAIRKVVFKKGCQLPSYGMERETGTDIYVLEKDVVFESTNLASVANETNWEKYYNTDVMQVISGHNGNQISFQLSESDYSEETVKFSDNGSKEQEYNFLDKDQIKVYTTSGETYLGDTEIYQWGNSYYRLFDKSNNITIGLKCPPSDISKIVIPKGTVFPSYKYAKLGQGTKYGYCTTEDITFVNKADTSQTNPYGSGICWSVLEMEVIDATTSVQANDANKLGFAVAEITDENYTSGATFSKVDGTSVFTYTRGETTTEAKKSPRINETKKCIWLQVDEITDYTSAQKGDVIELRGLWQYSVDRKGYNLGTLKYEFDGNVWKIWEPDYNATLVTLQKHVDYNENLTFYIKQIEQPQSDQIFTAASQNATWSYNGKVVTTNLVLTKSFGLHFNVSNMTGAEQTVAQKDDVIKLTGIWQYTDGKYYDFGTVEYKWNGSSWVDVNAPRFVDTGIAKVMICGADGKLIIKPTVSDYSNVDADTKIEGEALDKLKSYNFFDKITLTANKETKTLREILDTEEAYWYSLLVEDTIVIDMNNLWNGQSVTKITIDKGCEFPSYEYTSGASLAKCSYVTTESASYELKSIIGYNATYERDASIVKHTTTPTNIHVRYSEGDSYLLLFLSEHDYTAESANVAIQKWYNYNLAENIEIQTKDGIKKLSEILGQNKNYNIWGEKGCVAIQMNNEYTGKTVQKVIVKKGTEFPSYAYTSGSAAEMISYVTDKDYVFTTSKTDEVQNVHWTKTIPHSSETDVKTVAVTDNILTFTLSESDYVSGAVGGNHTDFDYWNNVQVYTSNTECEPLYKWADSTSATYRSNTLSVTGTDSIVRVVIPAKTVFPSRKYTSGQIAECVGYYVPGEKVFEKQSDGTWNDVSIGVSKVSGDVNGDGEVSSKDIVAMAKYTKNKYRYNASSLTYDDKEDDAGNRHIVRRIILGDSLHNYVKESDSLTYFSSSDIGLDSFLNDFYKRQVGYNDYVEGDMTVTSYKPGTFSDGVYNMGWTTAGLTWLDTANSLETDRLASQKRILENVIVDKYNYVWAGDDIVESPDTNMLTKSAKRSMAWPFPNATNTNGEARFWEFHADTSKQDTDVSTWDSNISATIANGLYQGTATDESTVWFEVKDGGDNVTQPIISNTEYAPWLTIDLRMDTADYKNIEDVIVYFTTGSSYSTNYKEMKASEYAALTYDYTEKYEHMLWFPMYQHADWNGKIYKLKIAIISKTGTTLSGTFALNYVRPSFDTRDSNTNGIYISSLKQYFDYTGDTAFLSANIEKARKAMNLYMDKMYDNSRNLIKQSYFNGHNGEDSLAKGLGNGYWDTLYKPEYDFESNMYFYQALRDLAEMEEILGESAKASSLNSTADAVLTAMRADVDATPGGFYNESTGRFAAGKDSSGNTVDYGYTTWNLQAIELGIATEAQARRIMSWIDGRRTVDGDTAQTTDIYKYSFAPRTATVNDKNIYGWLAKKKLSNVYNLGYGNDVQFGGAIMFTSYYDLTSRISVLGANNALDRLKGIQSWYNKVSTAYKNSSDPKKSVKDFYLPYFESINVTMQNGLREGGSNGAVGIDGEFTESLLVASAIPYGFFGMDSEGGKTLCVTPSLPSTMDHWKVENMQYNGVTYDLSIYKDAVRIDSVRGDATGLKVKVTLDCPEGKDIYVGGKAQNLTAGGKATVEVDFKDAIIEVKVKEK